MNARSSEPVQLSPPTDFLREKVEQAGIRKFDSTATVEAGPVHTAALQNLFSSNSKH